MSDSEQQEMIAQEALRVFKHSVLFHRLSGLWPKDDQPLGKLYKFKGYGIVLTFVCVISFQFSILTQDLDEKIVTSFLLETVPAFVGAAKVLPFIFNRKNVMKIRRMTLKINSSMKDTGEKIINEKWISIQLKWAKVILLTYGSIFVIYTILPWVEGTRFALIGVMPKAAYDYPWCLLVFSIQTIANMIRGIGIFSADFYCLTFICQLLSELEIVQYLVDRMESDSRILLSAMRRHSNALQYGNEICKNLSVLFLLQHFFMAVTTCILGAFIIYIRKTPLMMKVVLFIITLTPQILFICLVGEKLVEKSLTIASKIEIVYESYLEDTASLKCISLMLLRAQKPLILGVSQTTLDLRYFSLTMNKIYTFFMVLKSMIRFNE